MTPPHFNFAATGVGSMPAMDVDATCRFILDQFPEIPFWPQFVKLDPFEDMTLQYSEGLSPIRLRDDGKALCVQTEGMETELALFYEHYLDEDTDAFAIGPDHARGLYTLIDLMEEAPSSNETYVKGQSTGPITFASSVALPDGRSLLHVPDLLDAVVKGISIKLLWQAKMLARTGRRPILFIDEPALSAIGSAFSSMHRQGVVAALKETMDYCRERSNAVMGVHCCANTDWPMVLESGPDILNFDAYGYMDAFLLYPDEILTFVRNGGTIAWGIVPTMEFRPGLTAGSIEERLERGLLKLKEWGLEEDEIRARSMLTPSCGMGGMPPDFADEALRLLSELQRRLAPGPAARNGPPITVTHEEPS